MKSTSLDAARAEELILAWANLAGPDHTPDLPRFRTEVAALCSRYPEVFNVLREDRQGEPSNDDDLLRACWGTREHLRAAWMATDSDERTWYIFRLRQLYALHRRRLGAPERRKQVTRAARKVTRAMVARDKELMQEGETLGQFHKRLRSDPALRGKYFAPLPLEGVSDEPILPESVEDAFGRAGESFFADALLWGFHVEPRPAPTAFEFAMRHFAEIAYRTHRCANPKCLAPFFLMNKRRQQFCSAACAAPARRETKRRWWEKHKSAQLAKRKAKRRRQKR